MGLLNTINIDSEGIVPDSLKYIFEMKSTLYYKNREKMFLRLQYFNILFLNIYGLSL